MRWRSLVATAAALAMLIAVPRTGWPQSAPPAALGVQEQPQQAPPPGGPAQEAPARQENPGLINEIGKLFDKVPSMLPPLKSPGEAIDDLNKRARDAGEALSRMTNPAAMVTGRSVCPVSANGAPDCKLGADMLCQSKGFKEGKSLNTDSAQSCSAKVLIPGRQRKPDDCRTDNYVTRAVCE